MGAEYERKFRAEPAVQQKILADYPGSWETVTMETTYFDTPSRTLSARQYMLRKRQENGVSVCTLKTAGRGNLRGEWDVQSDRITAAVKELCKLDVPDDLGPLCAEGLIPICGAAFIRQALQLELPGCTAELALDHGRLFGTGELPLCEIELELKDGSVEALDAFAAGFATEYGLEPEEKSKFARALALAEER